VTVDELAGFLEHVSQLPGHQSDIYRLAEALGIDSDRVLRLTEAAELLNFCALAHGDIALTPLGETFAEAGIQARKEIFATRARRVPIVAWLLSLLAAADRHELERDVVESALRLEFPLDQAVRQVETLIDWGRYAELLAYDHGAGMIYGDTASVPGVRVASG
jgi:NitT/TauT family transport system ATP-binding protein